MAKASGLSPQSSPADHKVLLDKIRELEQQQAEAEALFSSIGQGAIATDKTGRINRINEVALDLLGLKRKDVINKWYPEAIIAENEDGEQIPPMDRPITKAFLTGNAVTDSVLFRRGDGSLLPVTVTVSPILFNGEPVGAIEVFRDISQEIEIDQMKSEFIYLASHQLRTPLTAVKTYAHMLHDGYQGQLTPEQQNLTKVMLSSLDRMNDIISTLLNISRIEAGRIALIPVKINLKDLIVHTLSELQEQVRAKNITVNLRIRQLQPIITDTLLAKEVISNLLSNAVKYTPPEGRVQVSVRQAKQGQIVRIQDSGYGIPTDSQKLLFSKFYRAPNVLDKQEEGTGLGLYLVRGVALALGGKVWFESKENEGSTFYLELPNKPPSDLVAENEEIM